MAGSLMKRDKRVEKNKRYLAAGVTGAGVAASMLLTPVLGVPVILLGGSLGYDWFRFRAKKGERYRVRTYAATLGSSLDARIWIRPTPNFLLA